ncbi:MAG: hypothetical protein LBT16_11160 [Treponema sp.]|jgi:hypothetical protein|nr:hypothetical protein [Treponema sp.]
MAQNHDYIPKTDGELLSFAKNLYAYALANFTRWEVPSPQAMLEAPVAAFETALAAYHAPNHGKVDTLAKNEAKKALTGGLRIYVQGYIARNPAVTDEDKESMGLPLRDTTSTPHPVPELKPETVVEPAGKGKHRVTAVNPETHTKEKPALVEGVAFAHRLRGAEEPQARAEDMPSVFQTGTGRSFQWKEADYGKVVDYATAYEKAGGERGPWSDVVSQIIA